ncbi:unnamed protein product, partial [marine sediment metagenome]
IKVAQVTNTSVGGLGKLTKQITTLATTFGVSSAKLIEVSRILAQTGIGAKNTAIALDALAKSTLAATFGDINQTAEGSIAIMRQFGIAANGLERALGAINSVASKFAVESEDIIAAVRRAGGVFAATSKGVVEGQRALEQFIALFTSVRATTRESAESIATGLRTIFTRIQRGSTIRLLREFGAELQDVEGKFVGPFEAIKRLSTLLKDRSLRSEEVAKILEELGGFRQISKVIPLIQQFATAQSALKVAQEGQDSLAKDAAVAQQALQVQLTKTKEKFLALFREITGSSAFKFITQSVLSITNQLIGLASAIKPILPALTAFATF